VGYSGLVIIARSGDTRLDELTCVDDLFVAVTDNVRADGWRIGFLGSVEEIVRILAADGGDDFEPLNSRALGGLLVWVEKAGLVTSPDRLAAALEESPGPFGDGIFAFAEALGIAELPE
jgi:hypothetical protein